MTTTQISEGTGADWFLRNGRIMAVATEEYGRCPNGTPYDADGICECGETS